MTKEHNQTDAARDKWIADSTEAFRNIYQIVNRAGCPPGDGNLDALVDCVRSVAYENEQLKTRMARIYYDARQLGYSSGDDPESLSTWMGAQVDDKHTFATRLRDRSREHDRVRDAMVRYRQTVDRLQTRIAQELFNAKPTWAHMGDPVDDFDTLIQALQDDNPRERNQSDGTPALDRDGWKATGDAVAECHDLILKIAAERDRANERMTQFHDVYSQALDYAAATIKRLKTELETGTTSAAATNIALSKTRKELHDTSKQRDRLWDTMREAMLAAENARIHDTAVCTECRLLAAISRRFRLVLYGKQPEPEPDDGGDYD